MGTSSGMVSSGKGTSIEWGPVVKWSVVEWGPVLNGDQ